MGFSIKICVRKVAYKSLDCSQLETTAVVPVSGFCKKSRMSHVVKIKIFPNVMFCCHVVVADVSDALHS